jgi:hypothetical protein
MTIKHFLNMPEVLTTFDYIALPILAIMTLIMIGCVMAIAKYYASLSRCYFSEVNVGN